MDSVSCHAKLKIAHLVTQISISCKTMEKSGHGIAVFTFTFMHLADAFIQSDLQCIQPIHFLSECVFPGNWTHNLLSHRNIGLFIILSDSNSVHCLYLYVYIYIYIYIYIKSHPLISEPLVNMSKGGFENFYPIIEEKQLKVRRESNDEIKQFSMHVGHNYWHP